MAKRHLKNVKMQKTKIKIGPAVKDKDAIWLHGQVPRGYWDNLENRKKYMRWLGHKLGYTYLTDWYQISTAEFLKFRGGGVFANYWNSSAIEAVKEAYPDFDWNEWMFHYCPRDFWQDRENHRRYMNWLEEQLDIKEPADWYQITNRDFTRHKGGAFLLRYNSTISAAVMAHHPEYNWQEWKFRKIPKGFWNDKRNRIRYMNWLGNELGYKNWDDWHHLTRKLVEAHYGTNFIKLYDGSPIAALKDCFPRVKWKEWIFARVPRGYWKKPANRKRYLEWLGKELGYKKPQDWLMVSRDDFHNNYGGGLLATAASYAGLLKEAAPQADWSSYFKKSKA